MAFSLQSIRSVLLRCRRKLSPATSPTGSRESWRLPRSAPRRLSKPEGILLDVSTGRCHPEIRAANETELYLTASCQLTIGFTETFPTSQEKYAVDLTHPNRARRIGEQA